MARKAPVTASRRVRHGSKAVTAEFSHISEGLRPLAVLIAKLLPDPANARRHPDRNMESIKASLARYGQRKPVVANRMTGIIEAGNATWEAARALGWTHLAVVYVEDNSTMAASYAIADNRTAELAEWDDKALVEMLKTLQVAGELPNIGFDEDELRRLILSLDGMQGDGFDPQAALDANPELAAKVQRGQVWRLGRSRLMCGDATAAADVQRLLGGAHPFLMVTDPPYGVDYDPAWRNEAAAQGHLAYAARRVGAVQNDDRVDWFAAWALFPGDVVYCWHADRHASRVQDSLERADFVIRCQIIWAKPHFPISRGHYHWRHEPCWYAVRKGAEADWIGGREETTLREIALDRNVEGGLSTQKPMECMAFPIRNHAGDVYDPFVGSGTTLIAAHRWGRTCYAMDIEPKWCAVSIARWEAETGESAVLDA